MEATWDWLNDDLGLYPLTVPITQVMVSVMVQWPPFAWATLWLGSPNVTLLLPNQATITYGNLWNCMWNPYFQSAAENWWEKVSLLWTFKEYQKTRNLCIEGHRSWRSSIFWQAIPTQCIQNPEWQEQRLRGWALGSDSWVRILTLCHLQVVWPWTKHITFWASISFYVTWR